MIFAIKFSLTLKHRETHGCVVSTVATDALVLKHQAISIFSTDSIYWTSFIWKYCTIVGRHSEINTLRPRQNGRHFPDGIFKWIFLNENVWILINISLKSVPRGPINDIPTLVQVIAWRRPGNKPLSEPMMVRLPAHICVTRPQWVKLHIEKNDPVI